ncbi:MAG: hypothetical protein ABR985_19625 [Methanotrichaceae archaeon]
MKKEEFMQQIEGCRLPDIFDQHLLDHAAEMFSKWGMTTHMDEKEHLLRALDWLLKPEIAMPSKRKKRHCVVCARR